MIKKYDATPESEERYTAWRNTIPFSNEAIAAAMEENALEMELDGHVYWVPRVRARAAKLRAGARVSYHDLKHTLARLVTLCAMCGRKALYRFGAEGRCREHKSAAAPVWMARRRMALESRSAAIGANQKAIDDRIKRGEQLRKHNVNKGRGLVRGPRT